MVIKKCCCFPHMLSMQNSTTGYITTLFYTMASLQFYYVERLTMQGFKDAVFNLISKVGDFDYGIFQQNFIGYKVYHLNFDKLRLIHFSHATIQFRTIKTSSTYHMVYGIVFKGLYFSMALFQTRSKTF